MKENPRIAIAVVGLGAILPDAPNVQRFWENVKGGRYSISEVDPGRWDPAVYYDPDPRTPDKTYSKIGGWVREWDWNPMAWKLPLPPRVADSIDEVQKWGLSCARATLLDYGWPERALDPQRTGVILGVASGGERQFVTSLRLSFPEFAHELEGAPTFAHLPIGVRQAIVQEARTAVGHDLPVITEDTMPGELANVVAGRIGSMFNLQGPNYICDAACASGLAAAHAAVGELLEGHCDAVIAGGIDHSMNATAYIKFSKIGALSATGTRPYADGADGFVMGEGAAFFMLKRLEDAERDGDRIYAVIRGFGASSDGRAKGITAPNPVGQRLAVERAWKTAGLPPASASMIEGHGTSTNVGDTVEVGAMSEVLREAGAKPGSIALGSVKSNIGHLKAAAGAAGLLKTVLALHEKVLPPSLHFDRPNPGIDFAHSPLRVNTELREWEMPEVGVRRAGVSAFGFGGTNFHGILEEYVPGRLESGQRAMFAIGEVPSAPAPAQLAAPPSQPSTQGNGSAFTTHNGKRHPEQGPVIGQALERSARGLVTGGAGARPEPVVITGAALGLPGLEHIFDDANVGLILHGEQLIDVVPTSFRNAMLDKHITRLVKSEGKDPVFEEIDDPAAVIRLAARGGVLDLVSEYGLSPDRVAAFDQTTKLAIGVGIDALRDAGIPLVMRYRTTTLGTSLPERWVLPESMRDDTGIIFASAFPGMDSFAIELTAYERDRARRERLQGLEHLQARIGEVTELDFEIRELRAEIERQPYHFDRRFLFKVLSMGHSQFAELLGVRGPNTQINSACASTTQAIALAEDWIRAGRCRCVVIIAADDCTSDALLEWVGAGFLASGAAATDDVVENAAIPFDRRRHGMIIGMGAAGIVVESAESARQRGIQPICEVVSAVTANSAYHGSRLDVRHVAQVMESLMSQAEQRAGITRSAIAAETVFVSHETYTPARGGSASAEVEALRAVFGQDADRMVVANTKGFTGHPLGVGIEDVVAVKALETGIVPPVPNFKEPDPELGSLNLSRGGAYPVTWALHLAAGFGSQVSMALLRWMPMPDGLRRAPDQLGYQYRVVDGLAWQRWLGGVAGEPDPELEVVQRTLRIRDRGRRTGLAPTAPEAKPEALARPARELVAESAAPSTAPPSAAAPTASPVTAPMPAAPTGPAVPAPAPTPTPVAPAAPPSADAVAEMVLGLVAEKTGYPKDMLDLDLDLEADLGVDTVKQAELFTSVRQAYGIPRDESVKLRDFPTLRHVIGFVNARASGSTSPEPPPAAVPAPLPVTIPVPTAPTPGAPVAAAPSADAVAEMVLGLVAEKTGYPKDMLDLDLDLEADLGVDTVKQAELFTTVRQSYGIPRDESVKLRDFPTLRHVIGFVNARASGSASPEPPPAAVPAPLPVTIPVPTAPTPTPVAPAPAPPSADAVAEMVLGLVAEKTGYPKDMLDLDLDLEADLGVDTVKQAELFTSVRQAYGIPRDESVKLRDFPTLRHVIGFVNARASGSTSPEPPPAAVPAPLPVTIPVPTAPTPGAPVAAAPSADAVAEMVLGLVAEKTGYPKDMLDLDLDLEADLGVDTVKQAELFTTVRQAYGIPRDESVKLRDFPTLRHVIAFVNARASGSASPEPPPAAVPAPLPVTIPVPTAPVPTLVAPAAAAPSAAAPSADAVAEMVLGLVAEKTGYPKDMLDLDLDLEADLGVDTVKQAELFTTVRQAYGIPRDESVKLRDFPTLRHVIAFVNARASGSTPPPAAVPASNVRT